MQPRSGGTANFTSLQLSAPPAGAERNSDGSRAEVRIGAAFLSSFYKVRNSQQVPSRESSVTLSAGL